MKSATPFYEYFQDMVLQSKTEPICLKSETYFLGNKIPINISLSNTNLKREIQLELRQNEKLIKLAKEIKSLLKSEKYPRLFMKNQEIELDYTLQNYDIIETCNIKAMFNLKKYDKLNWQTLKTGLIIQSICDYPECEAFQQKVYLNKGFGFFNIAQTQAEAQCPCCQQNFQSSRQINFGFINCCYFIYREKIHQRHRTETFDKKKYKIAQGLHILKQKSLQKYLEKKYKIEVRKLTVKNNQSFLVPEIVQQCNPQTERSSDFCTQQTMDSEMDWRNFHLFQSTDTNEKFKENIDSIFEVTDQSVRLNKENQNIQ